MRRRKKKEEREGQELNISTRANLGRRLTTVIVGMLLALRAYLGFGCRRLYLPVGVEERRTRAHKGGRVNSASIPPRYHLTCLDKPRGEVNLLSWTDLISNLDGYLDTLIPLAACYTMPTAQSCSLQSAANGTHPQYGRDRLAPSSPCSSAPAGASTLLSIVPARDAGRGGRAGPGKHSNSRSVSSPTQRVKRPTQLAMRPTAGSPPGTATVSRC
jgi:hypothetical protein